MIGGAAMGRGSGPASVPAAAMPSPARKRATSSRARAAPASRERGGAAPLRQRCRRRPSERDGTIGLVARPADRGPGGTASQGAAEVARDRGVAFEWTLPGATARSRGSVGPAAARSAHRSGTRVKRSPRTDAQTPRLPWKTAMGRAGLEPATDGLSVVASERILLCNAGFRSLERLEQVRLGGWGTRLGTWEHTRPNQLGRRSVHGPGMPRGTRPVGRLQGQPARPAIKPRWAPVDSRAAVAYSRCVLHPRVVAPSVIKPLEHSSR